MVQIGAAANVTTKVGRNDPCPCGSGRKYKHCCERGNASANPQVGLIPDSTTSPNRAQKVRRLTLDARKHWEAGRWAEANSVSREIARLCPDNSRAHYDLGLTCLRCGRTAEAAASLQRALELRPGFTKALIHLAHCHESEGRETDALLAYRRLGRMADDAVERRYFAAKALKMEGKLEEAEEELRRLIALAPQRAMIRSLLGRLLADRGKFEEAAYHFSQAIDGLPGAFQELTAIRRMTEDDRPLIDRMRVLSEGPSLDLTPRVCVYFGLGKAFDDLGDYAEAMRNYEAANRLKATAGRLERDAVVARYDKTIELFSAEALARARQSMAGKAGPGGDLPVFIVGMPRSGTTLVEQILSSHPAVAAGGELSFWPDRLRDWRASGVGFLEAGAMSGAAEDYLKLLRRFGPQALRVIDKAPLNFELLGPLRLIYPGARIIHCRRHPVDTCLSIFFSNFQHSQEYFRDRSDLAFFYRQYERLMDHWRSVLPADRFTEVHYETLIADREAETRRLVGFCGLEWDGACLAPERNRRPVRTASLWQVRQPVYTSSLERWRRYEPWLGELRGLLPGAVEGAGRATPCLRNAINRRHEKGRPDGRPHLCFNRCCDQAARAPILARAR